MGATSVYFSLTDLQQRGLSAEEHVVERVCEVCRRAYPTFWEGGKILDW
jgi:hypothetical protein